MIRAFLATAYLLLASCGVLVFASTPSRSLVDQGGAAIVVTWGVFCLVGGLSGAAGVISQRRIPEVLGAALGATASLTWCVSLILQAVSTKNAVPLTAACMAASLAAMLLKRCISGRAPAIVAARRKGRTGWWWHRRTP
jgi:hypothetical protein